MVATNSNGADVRRSVVAITGISDKRGARVFTENAVDDTANHVAYVVFDVRVACGHGTASFVESW
jgi:hypothetical protein